MDLKLRGIAKADDDNEIIVADMKTTDEQMLKGKSFVFTDSLKKINSILFHCISDNSKSDATIKHNQFFFTCHRICLLNKTHF